MSKFIGRLINKLDHPVYISYKGKAITISPRQTLKNIDKRQLSALPKGVIFAS